MKVLLISGARLRSHDLLKAFDPLLGNGFELSVVTWAAPTQSLVDACTEVVVHGPMVLLPDPDDDLPDPTDVLEPSLMDAEPVEAPPVPFDRARIRAGVIRRVRRVTDRMPDPVSRFVPAAQRFHGQRHRTKQLWSASRRDDRVNALAAAADMIVAVDIEALRTTWWLGRRYRRPELVLTVGSATALLIDRRNQGTLDGVSVESSSD